MNPEKVARLRGRPSSDGKLVFSSPAPLSHIAPSSLASAANVAASASASDTLAAFRQEPSNAAFAQETERMKGELQCLLEETDAIRQRRAVKLHG